MERSTLEWFDVLARALLWAAGAVLVLSVIGAISIVGSDNSLPFSEDVQREGRGIAAVGAVGGGLVAAGLLSGIGAILRLMVADRMARIRSTEPDVTDVEADGGVAAQSTPAAGTPGYPEPGEGGDPQ